MVLAFHSYLVIVFIISKSKLSIAHNKTFYNRLKFLVSRVVQAVAVGGVSRHRCAPVGTAGGPPEASDLLGGPLDIGIAHQQCACVII